MQYHWMGMVLKEFFLECLYFSEYDIRMFLFVFWLRNTPSIKYTRSWGNGGGSSKMCTGAYRTRGVEKLVIRYVRPKWMAPKKFCGICFVHRFGQVHKSITASNPPFPPKKTKNKKTGIRFS